MIQSEFLPMDVLLDIVPDFAQDTFHIDSRVIKDQLSSIIKTFKKELNCFVEYPYVDKFHRDSFYYFYSKKHIMSSRDSIRISFFDKDIDESNYFSFSRKDLEKAYFGFLTIRPTSYRVIGHTFVSPRIIKDNGIVCCMTRKTSSVFGRKLSVHGFPYCSQDNESITCSETSIVNLMDYFSNRYAEYSTLLPSKVAKILAKQTVERQLPSSGLPTENMSYVLKKLGFGTVVYSGDKSAEKHDVYNLDDFRHLFLTYIESGIPFIATLADSKNNNHHAIIVIGREKIRSSLKYSGKMKNCLGLSKRSKHFTSGIEKVVVMNDNTTPYELVEFNNPTTSSSTQLYFTSIVVPLYSKVFLEGYQFKKLIPIIIESLNLKDYSFSLIPPKGEYIIRTFLTSSKSYKEYIASSTGVTDDFKNKILSISTPKFIWVAEIAFGNEFAQQNQEINSIIVVDATESGDSGHLIFAANSQKLIYRNYEEPIESNEGTSKNGYEIVDFKEYQSFHIFATNLKGGHTSWES